MKDRIHIAAAPSLVWPFVADPVLMAAWNPKIVSTDRYSNQPVRVGERFSMIYRMSGRDRQSQVEVVECVEPVSVIYRHTMLGVGRNVRVDEKYTLTPQAQGTRVEQVIDLRHAGVPWFLRALIWFIRTTGHSSGETHMEQLRQAVEATLT